MDATRDYHIQKSKSERESQISYAITSMWNMTKNEVTYKTEADSQTQRADLGLPSGEGQTGNLGLGDANYYI